MNENGNVIIVRSDPSFEWERKPKKNRKKGAFKKALALALVVVLAFSGAVGGMFVYDSFIRTDRGGESVVIRQYTLNATQTSKPADTAAGDLSASQVYDIVSKSTVLFTCETIVENQGSSGNIFDGFGSFGDNFGFNNPFGQQPSNPTNPSEPQTSTAISYGSGIIMSQDGYIMTNAHVVDGTSKIMVTLFDGKQYEAKLVGSDQSTDIAVVKIDAKDLPAANFANSDGVVIGDDVYVVGNPLGVELSFSLTCGNVSSVRREIAIEDTLMTLMQVDAAVNPGNSGGPAADSRGYIIGVVNAKIVDDDVEGVGFAIPANTALKIASELITHGTVASRPVLGITVRSVAYSVAKIYPEQGGVTVDEVQKGSCAEKGGIKVGDEITHFNGIKVLTNAELNFQKEKHNVGDTVTVTVKRDGKSIDLTIVLGGADGLKN